MKDVLSNSGVLRLAYSIGFHAAKRQEERNKQIANESAVPPKSTAGTLDQAKQPLARSESGAEHAGEEMTLEEFFLSETGTALGIETAHDTTNKRSPALSVTIKTEGNEKDNAIKGITVQSPVMTVTLPANFNFSDSDALGELLSRVSPGHSTSKPAFGTSELAGDVVGSSSVASENKRDASLDTRSSPRADPNALVNSGTAQCNDESKREERSTAKGSEPSLTGSTPVAFYESDVVKDLLGNITSSMITEEDEVTTPRESEDNASLNSDDGNQNGPNEEKQEGIKSKTNTQNGDDEYHCYISKKLTEGWLMIGKEECSVCNCPLMTSPEATDTNEGICVNETCNRSLISSRSTAGTEVETWNVNEYGASADTFSDGSPEEFINQNCNGAVIGSREDTQIVMIIQDNNATVRSVPPKPESLPPTETSGDTNPRPCPVGRPPMPGGASSRSQLPEERKRVNPTTTGTEISSMANANDVPGGHEKSPMPGGASSRSQFQLPKERNIVNPTTTGTEISSMDNANDVPGGHEKPPMPGGASRRSQLPEERKRVNPTTTGTEISSMANADDVPGGHENLQECSPRVNRCPRPEDLASAGLSPECKSVYSRKSKKGHRPSPDCTSARTTKEMLRPSPDCNLVNSSSSRHCGAQKAKQLPPRPDNDCKSVRPLATKKITDKPRPEDSAKSVRSVRSRATTKTRSDKPRPEDSAKSVRSVARSRATKTRADKPRPEDCAKSVRSMRSRATKKRADKPRPEDCAKSLARSRVSRRRFGPPSVVGLRAPCSSSTGASGGDDDSASELSSLHDGGSVVTEAMSIIMDRMNAAKSLMEDKSRTGKTAKHQAELAKLVQTLASAAEAVRKLEELQQMDSLEETLEEEEEE